MGKKIVTISNGSKMTTKKFINSFSPKNLRNLTSSEKSEIESLKKELERRESKLKDMKMPRVLYERLLIAGYTEKDFTSPERQDQILREVLRLIILIN